MTNPNPAAPLTEAERADIRRLALNEPSAIALIRWIEAERAARATSTPAGLPGQCGDPEPHGPHTLSEEESCPGVATTTPAGLRELQDIILNGGLRLPGFDHWRERASSKPSDPDDVRWDCSCGYSGSPEKVQRHWRALQGADR